MRPASIAGGAFGLLALAAGIGALAKVRILGAWWENPLPHQTVPKGLTSLSAAQCGACHQEIYQEWAASAHGRAFTDRQFQAEMTKLPSAQWLCLNCHTPLENQLPTIAIGVHDRSPQRPILKKNARYDRALSAEGITCAVCHVRDGVVLGPWGDSQAPHPVRKDPDLLTERNCANCHQATAAYEGTLVCTFDTAGEWRQSPYATRGQSCTHCHMPAVTRAVAAGGPVRESRRHLFFGSKIPKEKTLGQAHRKYYELYSNGLSVEALPGKNPIRLRVKNARAGHRLPTGDPERFILVKAWLLDAAGNALEQQTYRIGQQWIWYPQTRKVSDNSLKPLEGRVIDLRFAETARASRLRIIVENWRMSSENAAYHNLKDYPLFAEVWRTETKLR